MRRNILVTGSSSGIGACIASYLKSLDYNVLRTGRKDIGESGYFKADLSSLKELEALLEYAIDYCGSIDVLINNAGEYIYSPIEAISYENVKKMTKVNFMAPYYLISKTVPHMKEKKWGRIVNIGSISGAVGEAYASLYSATKSALTGLTKSLGLELAADGITVNQINPGWVETELTKKAFDGSTFTMDETKDIIPQKRFIEPIEVAHLVEYLISESAKGITGQSINLCAGLSIG